MIHKNLLYSLLLSYRWGGKEDGGVVIGNNDAKVLKSTTFANGVVHEVDGFVAP